MRNLEKLNLVECASVGVHLPEKVAREVDELCKSAPADCEYQRKSFIPDAMQFEPGERAEVSIITTATVDKTNEVVLPEGVVLDAYNKSRIVLYNHDKHQIVGESQWVIHYPQDNSLRAKTLYYENVEGVESKWYKFVDEVWLMVKAGAMKGKSIGFKPLLPMRDPTPEELAAHPEWEGAGIWEKSLLLEYSVCPVGVNNDALVEVINTKSLDVEKLTALGLDVPVVQKSDLDILLEVYKSDDCVSNKIKYLYDNGEDKKYSRAQIEAIAYSHCHAKAVKKKARPKKKSLDVNKALCDLLDRVADHIDVERVVREAQEMYRNRGRV